MSTLPINTEELNYEVPMTIDELRDLIYRAEHAAVVAKRGQIFRVKIHPEICLVFKELDIKNQIALPKISSQHERDTAQIMNDAGVHQ